MSYERNQEAWDALRSECDELAQTVEVMRDALHVAVETDQLQGGLWEERAVAALALPNTAAAILRQRDVRTIREVAAHFATAPASDTDMQMARFKILDLADQMENGK